MRQKLLHHGESKIPILLEVKHFNKAVWNRNTFFLKQSIKSVTNTYNLFTVFMLTLNAKFVGSEFLEKTLPLPKHVDISFMTQSREKWDSHVLSGSDFWMVWWCHGTLRIHFYLFLFRSNVRKGCLDESDFCHCIGILFLKVLFRKFPDHNYVKVSSL